MEIFHPYHSYACRYKNPYAIIPWKYIWTLLSYANIKVCLIRLEGINAL